jgi:hypothetical protein
VGLSRPSDGKGPDAHVALLTGAYHGQANPFAITIPDNHIPIVTTNPSPTAMSTRSWSMADMAFSPKHGRKCYARENRTLDTTLTKPLAAGRVPSKTWPFCFLCSSSLRAFSYSSSNCSGLNLPFLLSTMWMVRSSCSPAEPHHKSWHRLCDT